MDLGISGKRAIVCASSRGLGRACAEALAREGVDVVINGRDLKTLKVAAREIRAITSAARRLGRPEEFGATCAFLCSVHAGYISGQNLQLDGGSYAGLL